MSELVLPRTDAGVAVQVVVAVVVLLAGLWATRRRPDARLVVVGAGLVLVGLIGLRAAH